MPPPVLEPYFAAACHLDPGLRPWFPPFLEGMLAAARGEEQGWPCWHDPEGLRALFELFVAPAPASGVKARVEPQPAGPCLPEGTRIAVHLRDTPFVLTILRNYLKKSRLTLHALFHTTFATLRDEAGNLAGLESKLPSRGWNSEIMVIFLVATVADDRLEVIRQELLAALTALVLSVRDFPAMRQHLRQESTRLTGNGHIEEGRFLQWLLDHNFVFMGLCAVAAGELQPAVVGLGLFQQAGEAGILERILPGLRPELISLLAAAATTPLSLEYCRHGQSLIYAEEGVDVLLLRHDGGPGLLLLGRFSRTALASRAGAVPILSQRLIHCLGLAGYPGGGYLHHEFRSLYDRMPLRELFYSEPATITAWIRELLAIQGDMAVRVLLRPGARGRYLTVLAAFSRNRYRAGLEGETAALLSRHLGQPVAAVNAVETGPLFCIVCYLNPVTPLPERAPLEAALRECVLTWEDRVRERLAALPVAQPRPASGWRADPLYQEATPPDEAVRDLLVLDGLEVVTTRVERDGQGEFHVKILSREPLILTSVVATLANMGLSCHEEIAARLHPAAASPVWVRRIHVGAGELAARLEERAALFSAAVMAVLNGLLRDDPLNQLTLLSGFTPRDLCLAQAWRQHLQQLQPTLARATITRVLLTQYRVTTLLRDLFIARFDPARAGRGGGAVRERAEAAVREALLGVHNLVDDQVLRALHHLVLATVRTNLFQHDLPPVLALKVRSRHLPFLAAPQPWREVFVLAPRMEGVHLRGGAVARGGIRFSDRLEDYRTEVLGLMLTQTVKNALIVPTGAKGGFVVPEAARAAPEARPALVAAQYQLFIRALLAVTDNRQNGAVVHPPACVLHEGADTYLVVAADKGTATFSDLANRIARAEFDFWLGDAFASGGSQGYDHKQVGITARGAWESIRLHLRELGRDPEELLTVVGIGDMSGDVFGNGLLASRRLRLLGAFNHEHVFLDPDPDPEASYRERERLFRLPRSRWSDYDTALLSPGGGVFPRNAKAIPLTPALQRLLATRARALSGEQVIRRLLMAPVDLLYNGGIGTYVKASREEHGAAADKVNDGVRVDAREVRARVVAEGGNLGLTPLARLELAQRGVLCNSDALDNSGGVHLSDREVNLKILCDHLARVGVLREARDTLLARLTGEVATQVLAENRAQHLAVSRDRLLSRERPDLFGPVIALLQREGGLGREETPEAFLAPEREGLPRPLLALLLGHAKILVNRALLRSDLPDQPGLVGILADYFPAPVVADYADHLAGHSLRREIIAATLCNQVIDCTGAGLFLAEALATAGRLPQVSLLAVVADLISAYRVVDVQLGLASLRLALESLAWERALALQGELEAFVLHLAGRFVAAGWVGERLEQRLAGQREALLALLGEGGAVPNEAREGGGVTARLALLPFLRPLPDMLAVREALQCCLLPIAHLFILVDQVLGMSWVGERLAGVRPRDVWARELREGLVREVEEIKGRIVGALMAGQCQETPATELLARLPGEELAACRALLAQAKRQDGQELLPLAVLINRWKKLVP